jgi:hypothetical protein
MTYLIGTILLLIFLGFALLMFLERLSALLALPLMALAFLLVAAAADLFQPGEVVELVTTEQVDQFGRRTVQAEPRAGPSRFAQWRALRWERMAVLRDQARFLADCVAALEAAVARADDSLPTRLLDELARIRTRETEFQQQAGARLAALPDVFARPPHHAGPRARFDDASTAMAISARLQPLARLAEQPFSTDSASRAQRLVDDLRRESRQWTTRHAALPAPASWWFWLLSAATYLKEYFILVIRAGSLHLSAAIIATVFGGMFAMYVKNLKVAERLVYWTAEYAGERPFFISLAVLLVTAGIFTSVGGLGTVIMLGTIILPVLRSVGLSAIVAAGVFLIAIAMGGTLQPVSRRLWLDFYGLPPAQLDTMLWTMVGLYLVCGVGWIWWGTRRGLLSSFQAGPATEPPAQPDVPARLMLAPLIPVALVYFAGVEEITAFTIAVGYMFVCVCRRRGAVRLLARSLIEGAQTVMPPVLLMVGIGLLVMALSTPPVQGYLRPLLSAAVPSSRVGYIALFALAAPLALYRGPLNVWGMGLAVSATLLATSALPAPAILGAILAAGMLQGVCDPTNTANVWIAGFQGVTVNRILRYTLLPIWAAAIVAVVIFGLRFVGGE